MVHVSFAINDSANLNLQLIQGHRINHDISAIFKLILIRKNNFLFVKCTHTKMCCVSLSNWIEIMNKERYSS